MIEQRSEAWFEQRKGRVTGSRIGAILGLNPWATPADVMRSMVRDFHGAESEFIGSIATSHGNMYEEMATRDLEMIIGEDIKETGFHEYSDWLGASPDGLVGDDWVVEIKCPYGLRNEKTVGKFKTLKQQMQYYAQVQFEMFTSGRISAYFYQWNPQGVDTLEVVHIDHEFINDAMPKLKAFHDLYLHEIYNPRHLEPLIQDINCDTTAVLLNDFLWNREEIKELTEKNKELLDSIVAICGGVDSVVHGHKLTHVTKDGAISYAKAIKDLAPDASLDAYKGKPSAYWLLK